MTYRELYNKALSLIETTAKNIGSYDPDVPSDIRNSSSPVRSYSETVTRVNGGPVYAHWGSPAWTTDTIWFKWYNTNDSRHAEVAEVTMINQLKNFLKSVGIPFDSDTNEVANTEVSTRGLINFYNNIASFLATKLIIVKSQLVNNSYVFYNPTDNASAAYNYDSSMSAANFNATKATASDVSNSIRMLQNTLQSVKKISVVRYNIQYSSTSSCSSSSSSSSSSSCSSSSCSSSSCSTIFIAYFNPSAV